MTTLEKRADTFLDTMAPVFLHVIPYVVLLAVVGRGEAFLYAAGTLAMLDVTFEVKTIRRLLEKKVKS